MKYVGYRELKPLVKEYLEQNPHWLSHHAPNAFALANDITRGGFFQWLNDRMGEPVTIGAIDFTECLEFAFKDLGVDIFSLLGS